MEHYVQMILVCTRAIRDGKLQFQQVSQLKSTGLSDSTTGIDRKWDNILYKVGLFDDLIGSIRLHSEFVKPLLYPPLLRCSLRKLGRNSGVKCAVKCMVA